MEERVMYCRKCDMVYRYQTNKCFMCGGKLVKAIKTEEKNYNSLRLVNSK